MKKKILITGANGQLGNEMRNVLSEHREITAVYTDVEQLDITDADAIEHILAGEKFTHVVNCAAYTAVDRAESNEELCHKLNAEAVGLIGTAANRHNCRVIHVSTDYVFDGTSCTPYSEDYPTHPMSVYGRTKLEGEKLLLDATHDAIILRTAWLYSPYGKNFVKTMIELGRTREELNVVYDQVGTPTYALDLAQAIVTIINGDKWVPGIYHFSNEGVTSWYDFTLAIHRLAGIRGCNVKPCDSSQFPTAATRPHYSVLSKNLIKSTFGITIPHWEESLAKCINRELSTHNK